MIRFLKREVFAMPLYLIFVCFFVPVIACKKGFDKYYGNKSPKGGYLYDNIKNNPNFSVFAQGLERANLVQYISKGGLYTVFAPTDDAFSKYLSAKGYGSVNDVPVDELFRILSFHIVNNMWYYYDLQQRFTTNNQILYLTRNKKFVNIDVSTPGTIKINGVPVVDDLRDIDAGNGVIHGLSEVLVPLPNLEQLLQSDPQLANSTFYKLLQVVADSAFDRFNTYDKDRDGRIDSVFYKTYPLLDNVYTSIEFRQNTAPENQGGDPVFCTILIPADDTLNAMLAPALAKIDPAVEDKIAALSPSYAEAVLESYFMYDTAGSIGSAALIDRSTQLRSVNYELIPALPNDMFLRKDLRASNGGIHVINTTFPPSGRLKSAMGQAMTDPELSTFMAAVQRAGLMPGLAATTRAGTFFAPTNAAFEEVGLDVKTRTLNGASLTATEFSNIIKHHIIDISLAQSGLTGSIATNLGSAYPLVFTNSGATVTSSGGVEAAITHPEVSKGPGNVGYVYKINKILLPKQ